MSSTPAAAPASGEAALVRAFGSWTLTASVINIIIGGGIFVLPASIAGQVGGFAPLVFVLGALAVLPVALCFAGAGSRVTTTGGPYGYVMAALGPLVGFLAGAMLWLCNISSAGGVANAFADQIARFFPALAGETPRAALLIVTFGVLTAINVLGVRLGAQAIFGLAILKLSPLILLAVVGLAALPFVEVQPLVMSMPEATPLGAAMLMAIFAYSGMETALTPSGETRDPARTVPRATIAAILICVAIYVALQLIASLLLGPALATSSTPLADAAGTLWGPATGLLLVTAAVSMLGFLQGNLLCTPRGLFALARDGFLPRTLATVSPGFRTPAVAIVLNGIVSCALALAGDFEALILLSSGAVCIVYLLVAIAAWRLQRNGVRGDGEPFRLPGGFLIPLLAIGAMVWVLSTLQPREWTAIGWTTAILLGLYASQLLLRRRRAA